MELLEPKPIEGDYDIEIIGYAVYPVVELHPAHRIHIGEVQLIALLGILGLIATWLF